MANIDSEPIIDLLYGELSEEEAVRLRAQIAADPEAAAQLAAWSRVREVVGQLPEVEPDPQVHYDILRAAREAAQPAKKSAWSWFSEIIMNPAFAGMALMVLAAGTFIIVNERADAPGESVSDRLARDEPAPATPSEAKAGKAGSGAAKVADQSSLPGFGGEKDELAEAVGSARAQAEAKKPVQEAPAQQAQAPAPPPPPPEPEPVATPEPAPAQRFNRGGSGGVGNKLALDLADGAGVEADDEEREQEAKADRGGLTAETRRANAETAKTARANSGLAKGDLAKRGRAENEARATEAKAQKAKAKKRRTRTKPERKVAVTPSKKAPPRVVQRAPASNTPATKAAEPAQDPFADVQNDKGSVAPVETAPAVTASKDAPAPDARDDRWAAPPPTGGAPAEPPLEEQAARAPEAPARIPRGYAEPPPPANAAPRTANAAPPAPGVPPSAGGGGGRLEDSLADAPADPDEGEARGRASNDDAAPEPVVATTGESEALGGDEDTRTADGKEAEASKQAPTPPALTAARSARRQGNHRAAVRSYEEYLAGYRGHREFAAALYETAQSYERLGEFSRALNLYRAVRAAGGRWVARADEAIARLNTRVAAPKARPKAKKAAGADEPPVQAAPARE